VSVQAPDAEFLERVRAVHEGRLTPTATRDAATVVLVRDAEVDRPDGTGRLEVFLLRRVATMAFGAGMHVFPGGKVDPSDELDPAISLPLAWADLLAGGDQARLRRIIAAAVRETREEAGVVLDPLQLRPFAHWITPAPEVRRYDTRFLICALPVGQQAQLADGEADRGLWATPQLGLTLTLMPPTRATLQDLAECRDTAEALARERVIKVINPRFIPDGEGFRFTLDEA
jgi:8-oxo-dGTP pyrophosphatase MutT (NUDIX family)